MESTTMALDVNTMFGYWVIFTLQAAVLYFGVNLVKELITLYTVYKNTNSINLIQSHTTALVQYFSEKETKQNSARIKEESLAKTQELNGSVRKGGAVTKPTPETESAVNKKIKEAATKYSGKTSTVKSEEPDDNIETTE
jgi:hypothetical protein